MATETAPIAAATTEKGLRDRIHRIFSGEVAPSDRQAAPPDFWVKPTEEQKNTRVLNIHEGIDLTDEADIRAVEHHAVEHQWLNSPHVDLEGMSPEAMLAGDERSRERLDAFVTDLEAAMKGSFI